MSEGIKMCVYCEHCEYTEAEFVRDWSLGDWMDDPFYACEKKHFSNEDPAELEGWALRAMTCPDYELSHKVQEEIKKGAKND